MIRREVFLPIFFFLVVLVSSPELLRPFSLSLDPAVSTTRKARANDGDHYSDQDKNETLDVDTTEASSNDTIGTPDSPPAEEKKRLDAGTEPSKTPAAETTEEHDYEDYASWLEDDWESPLIPSLDAINAQKFRSSNCTRPDRILYLPTAGIGGLTDRTGKINILVALACRLQAQVYVTPPHDHLFRNHNNKKSLPKNLTWDRYTTFHTFVEEASESGDPIWQACPENTLITMDESGDLNLKEKITKENTFEHAKHIDLKLVEHAMKNTNEPLFWNLELTRSGWYGLESVYKRWQEKLPGVGRKCDAERLFSSQAVDFANQVKQESLGGGESYLGIKLRRTDDLSRTGVCTEADRVAVSVREVLVKRNFSGGNGNLYIFVMMSPEPEYRDQLGQALKSALSDMKVEVHVVFESDSPILRQLEESDNFLAYSAAYTVLEDSPLGRIEARRFDKGEHQWGKNRTCGIRYAKTQQVSSLYKRRFLEVGYLRQFHQIYPEYIPVDAGKAKSEKHENEKTRQTNAGTATKRSKTMKPVSPTEGHDYEDYASWADDAFESSLIPSINAINARKFRSSNCTRPDRILYLPTFAGAGLTDRTGKLNNIASMACRLQAQVWVTPPHTMLIRKHNNRRDVSKNITWDHYLTFPTFVEEKSETSDPIWQACPENGLITMDESGSPHLKDKITKENTFDHFKHMDLKLVEHAMNNPNEPLFWNLELSRSGWYGVGSSYKLWQDKLPDVGRKCDAERLFSSQVADVADQVKQESLGNGEPYLGIKVRRTDDVGRTGNCTDPVRLASSVREVVAKRNYSSGNGKLYIYVMMSPEPDYRDQLEQALKAALTDMQVELHIVFESDSPILQQLENSDNYLAYSAAYAVLEDAPLGRIEVRRFDKGEQQWGKDRTCGIRFAKTQPVSHTYTRRFLEAGFMRQFHQIYPEYIPVGTDKAKNDEIDTKKGGKKKADIVDDSSKAEIPATSSEMQPIAPTEEHDYEDYASWVEDDWESPLIPSIDAINAQKFRSSNCTRPDRILYLPTFASAGLTDRTGKLNILAAMACRLQAQIWVTPPHTMLVRKHNNRRDVAENITWDYYMTFPSFVEEKSETGDPVWKACPEKILITMGESGASHLEDRITDELTFEETKHIGLKLVEHAMKNPNEPFFWNLKLIRRGWYGLESTFRKWQKNLPDVGRKCDVERLFSSQVADIADQVKKESLGGGEAYLSIKLRRTDNESRTRNCTDPDRVASSVRDVLVKRNYSNGNGKLYIFVMMSPEPEYRDQLDQALKSALTDVQVELHVVFESDSPILRLLEESDNYLAYSAAYTILEDSPLGRIDARRFDRKEHQYRKNSTCGIRYAKTQPVSQTYKRRFLESGYLRQFHQIYPEYIP